MVTKDGDLVAIFHSVHRVLKAEKVLKEGQLSFRLIPAPRQLAADCGLAISFDPALRSLIDQVLSASGVEIVELWRLSSGQYLRVEQD